MSAMQQAEVLGFSNGSVYQSIMSFLNDGISESTKKSYEKTFHDFFKYVCKKDMSLVTEEDLLNIKNEEVKNFRSHLERKDYAKTSINQKLRAISSLFQYLAVDRDKLNPAKVYLKPKKEAKNHYGFFTQDELNQIIEYTLNHLPNGVEKSLLIRLAIKTSYRKEYLLSLTWKDIRKYDDNHYEIKGKDDSSKHEEDKTIEKELYEELLQLKKGNDRNDTIFHMTGKTASELVRQVVKDLNLDPDENRNLAFHSLKSAGINEVYSKTKDIRLMAKQGNHSAETALGHYSRLTNDPLQNPSLLIGKTIDISKIEEVSKEDLIKAIMECDDFVKIAILDKLNG